MVERLGFRHVVMQPTTGCNLNCGYCYLPERKTPLAMSPRVAEAVARSVEDLLHPVQVLWHGGEPLSCGVERFVALLEPFDGLRAAGKVTHTLQTNGTLITEEWCEVFHEKGIGVGLSIDGQREHNRKRVNWAGKQVYDAILRGSEMLRRHGIRFGVIAVVTDTNIDDPEGFYEFFAQLGCAGLNINVEEREGLNAAAIGLADERVRRFWRGVFKAWIRQPSLRVREIDNVLGWMHAVCEGQNEHDHEQPTTHDLWPTVAWNGDVVVVSPELIASAPRVRQQFVVGNVLGRSLRAIVEAAGNAVYVAEFFSGLRSCRDTCGYFSYCGGGQGSNKFFELGRFDGTETAFCRHTRQAVVDAVLMELKERKGETDGTRRQPVEA